MPSPSEHQLLVAIHQTVGQIQGQQSAFLDQFKQHVEDDKRAWEKVDDLITHQEAGKGAFKALVAVFGLVSGAIGAWVSRHFT